MFHTALLKYHPSIDLSLSSMMVDLISLKFLHSLLIDNLLQGQKVPFCQLFLSIICFIIKQTTYAILSLLFFIFPHMRGLVTVAVC